MYFCENGMEQRKRTFAKTERNGIERFAHAVQTLNVRSTPTQPEVFIALYCMSCRSLIHSLSPSLPPLSPIPLSLPLSPPSLWASYIISVNTYR